MTISEQDGKRLQELAIKMEALTEKIRVIIEPFREGKFTPHNLEQGEELGNLFNQRKQLERELISIPKR